MSKKELEVVDSVNEEQSAIVNQDEVLATIIKLDDGYHVVDKDGTTGPVCKITKDGEWVLLSPNASNRKCIRITKLVDVTDTNGYGLTYKATRTLGPMGSRPTTIPNAKLIAYLSEEEQEEYKDIIARAIEARDADKKKPVSEEDKLRAKIAKLQEQLAAYNDKEDNN